MSSAQRVGEWLDAGPFTPVDTGVYRIVFATVMLLRLNNFEWVAGYPDSLYAPPAGPFRLFHGFPPKNALRGLDIALAMALVALLVGWHTTTASLATAALLVTGFGFSYSLGKIDHSIFQVVTPLVMALARWGTYASVDARRRGRPAAPTPQWAMRFLALLVGGGFFTAAVPKILAGWLSPRTQAVRGVALGQYYVEGRTRLLAGVAIRMPVRALWEVGDWATVGVEGAVLFSVVSWSFFRSMLAILCLFHLMVMLMLNISFASNVLVYGAFASWSVLAARTPALRRLAEGHRSWFSPLSRGFRPIVAVPVIAVPVLGVAVWAFENAVGSGRAWTGYLLLIMGAAVGLHYLAGRLLAGAATADTSTRSPRPARILT